MQGDAASLIAGVPVIFSLAVCAALLAKRLESTFFTVAVWVLGMGGLSVGAHADRVVKASASTGLNGIYAVILVVCCGTAVVVWRKTGQLAMLLAACFIGLSAIFAFFDAVRLLTRN